MKVNPNLLYDSGTGYIKFEDGTMICYGEESGTGTRYDYWSNFDRIPVSHIAFPVSFKENPFVSVMMYQKATLSATLEYISTTEFNINLYKPKNTNNNNYEFYWIAIGKWK